MVQNNDPRTSSPWHATRQSRGLRWEGLFFFAIFFAGCDAALRETASGGASQRHVVRRTITPPLSEKTSGDELRAMIDEALDYTEHHRELSLEKNAAWQILHGVLAFGRDFQVRHAGQQVGALDWALGGGQMKGWTLRQTPTGLRAVIESGKNGQGHEDQWLAVVSQCGLPPTHPLEVDGNEYQIYDLITQAMVDTYDGKECSWSLIALSQYLNPIDQSWEARDGTRWTVERMLSMEGGSAYDDQLGQQLVNEGACGGTHRLIGMAMALGRYHQQYPDRELTGGWQAAIQRINWAVEAARKNQLPSGAFSIHYFLRPSHSMSVGENLTATGHTLEFLSTALDRAQLSEPWVCRAVVYLCDLLEETKSLDLECGALYHAAHGLVLYRNRCFAPRGEQSL